MYNAFDFFMRCLENALCVLFVMVAIFGFAFFGGALAMEFYMMITK